MLAFGVLFSETQWKCCTGVRLTLEFVLLLTTETSACVCFVAEPRNRKKPASGLATTKHHCNFCLSMAVGQQKEFTKCQIVFFLWQRTHLASALTFPWRKMARCGNGQPAMKGNARRARIRNCGTTSGQSCFLRWRRSVLLRCRSESIVSESLALSFCFDCVRCFVASLMQRGKTFRALSACDSMFVLQQKQFH